MSELYYTPQDLAGFGSFFKKIRKVVTLPLKLEKKVLKTTLRTVKKVARPVLTHAVLGPAAFFVGKKRQTAPGEEVQYTPEPLPSPESYPVIPPTTDLRYQTSPYEMMPSGADVSYASIAPSPVSFPSGAEFGVPQSVEDYPAPERATAGDNYFAGVVAQEIDYGDRGGEIYETVATRPPYWPGQDRYIASPAYVEGSPLGPVDSGESYDEGEGGLGDLTAAVAAAKQYASRKWEEAKAKFAGLAGKFLQSKSRRLQLEKLADLAVSRARSAGARVAPSALDAIESTRAKIYTLASSEAAAEANRSDAQSKVSAVQGTAKATPQLGGMSNVSATSVLAAIAAVGVAYESLTSHTKAVDSDAAELSATGKPFLSAGELASISTEISVSGFGLGSGALVAAGLLAVAYFAFRRR